MSKKAIEFFKSYNKAIEDAYENHFEINKNENLLKQKDDRAQEYFNNRIRDWYSKNNKDLDDQSPIEFISTISNFSIAEDMFKIGAKVCDKDLPEIFIDKFKSFGEEAYNCLFESAFKKAYLENEEDVFISIMAIRLIGEWKLENAITKLVDLIYELDEEKEIVVEEIVSAFINIGSPATKSLIKLLETKDTIGYIDEYILSAVENIGKNNKSDLIFKCLKDAFLKMEDKVLGAMCLGDYGDGRAIPTLRGYIEKNKSRISKETYNEIKAAIKRLGGSITDL